MYPNPIHRYIEEHGLHAARQAFDQELVEAAFSVMADEAGRLNYIHTAFSLTCLPHRDPKTDSWTRQNGRATLRIETGKTQSGKQVGLPYGATARMILIYLQTQAIRTQSREIELGSSMYQWMTAMDMDLGGRNYQMIRTQSARISHCRLTFYYRGEKGEQIHNGGFVRDAIIPYSSENANQLSLWRECVVLDEAFYTALIKHPLPVRETAIRALAGRSLPLDIYVWLAYRLHVLDGDLLVPWSAIHAQFGHSYQRLRAFKTPFADALALALAAYPGARVTIDEDRGCVLHPSDPPVPLASITGSSGIRAARLGLI